MTKANVKSAVKQAASNKAASTPAKTAAPTALEQERAAALAFVGKVCKVIKGRKHLNETVKVFYATKGSAFRKPALIAEVDGVDGGVFFAAGNLEIVGDMNKADNDRLTAKQKAEQEETLYILATAVAETDKTIQLSYPRWAKNLWFAKPSMISIAATTPDGGKVFEIAAWKIKKECGMDAYDALQAQQTDLEKIVNAS